MRPHKQMDVWKEVMDLIEGIYKVTSKFPIFTMSRGSLSELDAQLEISSRLNFITKCEYDKINERLETISRMLQGLIKSRERITQ